MGNRNIVLVSILFVSQSKQSNSVYISVIMSSLYLISLKRFYYISANIFLFLLHGTDNDFVCTSTERAIIPLKLMEKLHNTESIKCITYIHPLKISCLIQRSRKNIK